MTKQQKDTVREQTNSTDPRKPPRMVSHSEEPSCRLNICIPANTSTDSRLDNTRDVLVFTAIKTQRKTGSKSAWKHQSKNQRILFPIILYFITIYYISSQYIIFHSYYLFKRKIQIYLVKLALLIKFKLI